MRKCPACGKKEYTFYEEITDGYGLYVPEEGCCDNCGFEYDGKREITEKQQAILFNAKAKLKEDV